MAVEVEFSVRFSVLDAEVSRLHHTAFGGNYELWPWRAQLEQRSKSWVGAFDGGLLVGFVHAVWDGGRHAFLLDTAVDPRMQRRGVGTMLVSTIVSDLKASGIEWLHVDYPPHLSEFYTALCGFEPTSAGLMRLT